MYTFQNWYKDRVYSDCECGETFAEHGPVEIEPDVFMPGGCVKSNCKQYHPCYEDYEGPTMDEEDYGPRFYCPQCELLERMRLEGLI